ncbi:recombinase family protein [Cupriavidus metallidurans]|uniref:recombinase family protein n=1 Tax=Cupriavidus metallidurans TaxID=119219 RepID=UPI0009B8D340|nr:recombinase family protein [Cupriavidus metallidurans]
MLVGYARVSTQELETHAQTDALREAGVGFFREAFGGGTSRRPALDEMLTKIGPGDSVVVCKFDRIAHPLKVLLITVERIEVAGTQFRSLVEHIDARSPAGRMIFQIVGAFAGFERELIRERSFRRSLSKSINSSLRESASSETLCRDNEPLIKTKGARGRPFLSRAKLRRQFAHGRKRSWLGST